MSATYDPSRDQNALGGPGAGLDGGGYSMPGMGGVMSQAYGAGPSAPATNPTPTAVTSKPDTPILPDPAVSTPAPSNTPAPAATSTPPVASTPSLPTGGGGGGFSGGDIGATPSASPSMAGGAKVGLDGGATAAGPGQFFADGGSVEDTFSQDGSDPQGAMGTDPISQMISSAMDSVDKAFAFGRQKNGLGQQDGAMPTKPGQQSETPGGSGPPTPGALASDDGDQDDTPGSQVASQDDGDQDDEGAA